MGIFQHSCLFEIRTLPIRATSSPHRHISFSWTMSSFVNPKSGMLGSPRDTSKIPDLNQRSSHQQTVPVEEDLNPFGDHSPYRDDLPPSYEEASSSSQAPNTSTDTTAPPSTARPKRPPSSCHSSQAASSGYTPQRPMSAGNSRSEAQWEAMRGKPGCCFSDSGGCCFSSRGGCCFSDRGGCCFSDREGCCFSDRKGCFFSDHGGGCCG